MQHQLNGNIIPANNKKGAKTERNMLNTDLSFIGIELVRFDDEDNEESSMKVAIAPFLAPWKKSESIFG